MSELDIDSQIKARCQQFRELWQPGQRAPYEFALRSAEGSFRSQLLVRLIQIDLELALSRSTTEFRESVVDENDARIDPRLDLLLTRFQELHQQKQACLELAAFEYALRRNSSCPFSIQHYLDLFPHLIGELEPLLHRTEQHLFATWMVPQAAASVDKKDSTIPDGVGEPLPMWKLPKHLGNFLLLSLAGTGGMGAVFRALDLRSGGMVAVKIIKRVDSWSIFRFNEEFRVLATMEHPNLVKMYHSFVEGNMRYYSMELLNGLSIDRWWLRYKSHPDRWSLLQEVLRQIASAIHFLHQRGVTHGDIKSANILVSRRGRSHLLDFGLARFANPHELEATPRRGRLVGTLNYMAPELLAGQQANAASDWYSFGANLCELLTSKTPDWQKDESGQTVRLDLIRQLEKEVGIPLPLQLLCQSLLELDPKKRPSGQDCMNALRNESANQSPLMSLGVVDFVGRRAEISWLCQHLSDNLADRAGRLLVIEGIQGIGKSRLLAEWIKNIRFRHQAIVVQATCLRKDGMPCRLINHLIQSFVAQAIDHPKIAGHIAPEVISDIAKGFPQIRQLHDSSDEDAAMAYHAAVESSDRNRSCMVFANLLGLLSQHFSITIAIDDYHLADVDSLNILQQLWSGETPFRGMLVVSLGSPESTPPRQDSFNGFLQSLRQQERAPRVGQLELTPMEVEDRMALANQLLARDGMPMLTRSDVARQLVVVGNGIPQLMEELVLTLVNDDATGASWPERLAGMQGLKAIHVRFRQLTANLVRILQYLAIAQQPLTQQQLQGATRISPEELIPALGDLADKGWLQWLGLWPDLSCQLTSDEHREFILARTPFDKLRRRHHRLAQSLAREVPPPWEQIAGHYESAGELELAQTVYFQAADDYFRRRDRGLLEELLPRLATMKTLSKAQQESLKRCSEYLKTAPGESKSG